VTDRTLTSPCSKPSAGLSDEAGRGLAPIQFHEERVMKRRNLMAGLITAGLANAIAGAALADTIQIAVSTNPNSYGVAEIKVDGPSADGIYTEVRNETLDYIVSARGDRPKKSEGNGRLEIQFLEGSPQAGGIGKAVKFVHGELTKDWKSYKVSVPYVDPWSRKLVNDRVSPIEICNDNLALRKNNPNRRKEYEEMQTKGLSMIYHDAYKIRGYVEYPMKSLFDPIKSYDDIQAVPLKVTCMPLDRIRPHKDTSTTGAPGPKGKPLPPTVSNATLRIEPAKVVQDGVFLCPSQLKLYGHVEAIREFYGKALFVGPHYLSAITTLNFQGKGSRNVNATYEMNWHPKGGFTTQPNAEPAKQKLTFRFNVADKDGKLRKSVEETVEVSCKKIKVGVPTVGDEMTVAPAN
jgi:hypothetical protein